MMWTWLNWLSVFIYGTALTLSFLNIKPTRKNVFAVVLLTVFCIAAQALMVSLWGFEAVNKAYPLIVHLPLFLLCVYFYKIQPASALISILTAFLLTVPRNLLGQVAATLFPGAEYAMDMAKFLITFPLLFLLLRFWSPGSRIFLRQRSQVLWIMAIPFELYYITAYVTTVYTDLLWQSNVLTTGTVGMLFALVLCALSSVVGRQNERVLTLQQRQKLLSLQSSETEKRMEEIRYSQQKTRAMRHDMRHYLQIIDSYAAEGDTAAIQEYIRQVQTGIDETVVSQYCLNEQVNLVLSSCVGKAKKQDVEIVVSADIPETLEDDRTLDLCILLANAMENAVTAAAETAKPWVELSCGTVGEKLVVLVSNSCGERVEFENSIPKSHRAGHGFGTYSIAMLAEKHGGTADFSCRDGIFTMRAVL